MKLYDIIRRPLVTEKAARAQMHQQFVFEVNPKATKPMIRQAVESLFKVKVKDIRTSSHTGKSRRSWRGRSAAAGQTWKKATVTLAEGEKLELFEGV